VEAKARRQAVEAKGLRASWVSQKRKHNLLRFKKKTETNGGSSQKKPFLLYFTR